MSLKQFLSSRVFLRQIIIAALLFVVLLFGITKGLKIYTHHGESFAIPDFGGMQINEAKKIAQQNNFKVEVTDSVFVHDVPPGAVVDQVPEAGFGVKSNRLIYLTINSVLLEKVTIPKLTDISFRQARVLIENRGLKIGNISYEPSEYNDLVLHVRIDSTDIKPGEKLTKGTSVDLVIGRNKGNMAATLPDLTGMPLNSAETALTNAMLNTGVLIYDNSIVTGEDSLNAFIWRQRPDPKITSTVNLGSSVDLWLTMDSLKLNLTIEEPQK